MEQILAQYVIALTLCALAVKFVMSLYVNVDPRRWTRKVVVAS